MIRVVVNQKNITVKSELKKLAAKADSIGIAVAFFSEPELIKKWSTEGRLINLIVSLRPPTSYYSLKSIQSELKTQIYFLGVEFHSKFWIFYKRNEPFAALLGSSNFSNGGLTNNIEANLVIDDEKTLSSLHEHFIYDLLDKAQRLQPSDLEPYKKTYDEYLKRRKQGEEELKGFFKKISAKRVNKQLKPCKEARQYFEFWRIVDEVREIVKPLCNKYFPGEPYYLVLDHFWHWVKAVWFKEYGKELKLGDNSNKIVQLFRQYIIWQNEPENAEYPKQMLRTTKTVFQRYLSKRNIDRLTRAQAKEVYQNLHSSGQRIQRFNSDKNFIELNPLSDIRRSLKYLIHSNDSMDIKIHNLLHNPSYKINELGPSGVQEINGWTKPAILPIRNVKADRALEILGYRFKD
jgi:HKD family nuclease